MNRILDLALKDLAQIFGDKRTLLFLIAMPIVFTLFMGFAYQSGGDETAVDPRLPLAWVNQEPGGMLSEQLHSALSNSDSIRLVELDLEAAQQALRKGDVAGVLIAPAGYSRQVDGGLAQLTLVADLNSPTGQSLFQMLRSPVTQLMSSLQIAHLSAEMAGLAETPAELEAGFTAASQAWSEVDSGAWIKVEQAVAADQPAWYGDNPYNQASPGILVQFAIFGLVTSGQIVMQERKTRTLQRMLTTSMRPWQIVAGHTLAMFTIVLLQEALLVFFGQFALGVNYARQPLGILLIVVGLGLWVAAMGLLIGVVARNDSQVVLYSLMAMFIFSALGGTWFPLEASSGAFAALSRMMPSAWAMTGFQNVLIRGLGMPFLWQPALILSAYALGFFGLAVWLFRKMAM